MRSAERRGEKRGFERGEKRGIELGEWSALKKLVEKKLEKGNAPEEIADILEMDISEVAKIAEEWKKETPRKK